MHKTLPTYHRQERRPYVVDNTDWLKTAAIILVVIDHLGDYFLEDDRWWRVFGRLAAPPFFFLLGYAQTQAFPLHWVWLGIILTLLNSWNANWTWVAPNILLSFVFIRIVRPHVQNFLHRRGWVAFVLLVSALLAMLPSAAKIVEYGSEGWLWALFGLCQRIYINGRPAPGLHEEPRGGAPSARVSAENINVMRLLACLTAAFVYVWQEQAEYLFPQIYFGVFVLGVCVLSFELYLFQRRPSRIQPPRAVATILHFIGKHTLTIYAIQLAASEFIVKFVPKFVP